MKPNRKLALVAVPLLAAVAGGALLWGPAVGAQEAEEPAALVKVSDQQNVTTDATGRVTLDLRNGEKNQRCLDVERIEAFTIQLAGNKSGGRDPLFVQTAQNTNCSIKLRFFDINTTPIAGDTVRLGYTADGQVQTFADGQAPAPEPEPEPTAEPTPEPDPDPEPGPSLLVDTDLEGDPVLPQGVTSIGDVEPGEYTGVVPDGAFCYAALLESSNTGSYVDNELFIGPANAVFTVPEDANPEAEGVQFDPDGEGGAEPVTARFIHVDCAAA